MAEFWFFYLHESCFFSKFGAFEHTTSFYDCFHSIQLVLIDWLLKTVDELISFHGRKSGNHEVQEGARMNLRENYGF